MSSKLKSTIEGLIFTIIFYCTFPFVYIFLLPMLMYGDEEVIGSMATLALILTATFLVIVFFLFKSHISRLRQTEPNISKVTFRYFIVLLIVSYPLIFFSPFIEYSTFGLKIDYDDALMLNISGGLIFLILGIFLDILQYRIKIVEPK